MKVVPVIALALILSSTVLSLSVSQPIFVSTRGIKKYIRKHTERGGSISGSLSGTFTCKTDSRSGSRAEYRRESQKSGKNSMGGRMKIKKGNLISLIQVLNVKSKGKKSGSSSPVAQLAARLTKGGKNYEFYIVQTGRKCSGPRKISPNQWVDIKMTYEKNKTPSFYIDGKKCSQNTGRKPGKYKNSSGRYYYGKLGAYNTSGGKTASTVQWKNVYD